MPTNEALFGVWSSPLCHVWQHNANVQFNRFIPFRHTWHMSIFSCLASSHAQTNVVAVLMLHSACRGLKLSKHIKQIHADSSLRTNENIPKQNGRCITFGLTPPPHVVLPYDPTSGGLVPQHLDERYLYIVAPGRPGWKMPQHRAARCPHIMLEYAAHCGNARPSVEHLPNIFRAARLPWKACGCTCQKILMKQCLWQLWRPVPTIGLKHAQSC